MNAKIAAAAAMLSATVSTAGPKAGAETPVVPLSGTGFVAEYLVKRAPGTTFEAFKAHQLETHIPLALALPGLEAYSLTFFPPGPEGDQAFDARATVRFESQAAHDAALASEAGQRALADLSTFLDMGAMRVLAYAVGDTVVPANAK